MSARPGLSAFRAILAAELLLLLRDRRALILAVVLPTALYPLIFLGQRWLQSTSRRALEERTVRVVHDLRGLEAAGRLVELLGEEQPITLVSADASPLIQSAEDERAQVQSLAGGPSGVVLVARPVPGDPPMALRLYFDGTNDEANQARQRVDRAIDRFQLERREEIVRRRVGSDPAQGLGVTAVDVSSPADAAGSRLGRIFPILAVIVLLSGGSYVALSAFAGEREAGTLETLLVQPAPAIAVVAAKFTAVLIAGNVTLLLNAASVLFSLHAGLVTLPGGVPAAGPGRAFESPPFVVDLARILEAGFCFFPAAVLLCALLCLVCGRARTFREGQFTLLPLMLVCLVPAGIASQDVDLDWLLAMIPLAGPALAVRDALRGQIDLPVTAWMLVANSVWAGLALGQLARTLDTERLVQNEGSEEESSQRSVQSRYALRWGWMAVFAVYVVGGTLQAWDMVWGVALTLWVILLPLALFAARGTARRAREPLARALHLAWPRATHALGAMLLAPALAALAQIVFDWQRTVLPLPSSIRQADLLQDFTDLPWAVRLFLLAISPAICEELFFRGAVLSGLRRDLGLVSCVAWQALLFGAAHSSIYRFIPTAILGMVLTVVVVRTGSVLPAILLHAAYNALLVVGVDSHWVVWLSAGGLLLLAVRQGEKRAG
ncbi:MAG: type II CAAX prenyl endopeptidase Rce1 family protein [Planctomycetota bacterium]